MSVVFVTVKHHQCQSGSHCLNLYLQQIMKDRWINAGFEEDEMKPYTEPELDITDQKRIGQIKLTLITVKLLITHNCMLVSFERNTCSVMRRSWSVPTIVRVEPGCALSKVHEHQRAASSAFHSSQHKINVCGSGEENVLVVTAPQRRGGLVTSELKSFKKKT